MLIKFERMTSLSTIFQSWTNPELVPKVTDKPKFDPDYGFAEPNPTRGILLQLHELRSHIKF